MSRIDEIRERYKAGAYEADSGVDDIEHLLSQHDADQAAIRKLVGALDACAEALGKLASEVGREIEYNSALDAAAYAIHRHAPKGAEKQAPRCPAGRQLKQPYMSGAYSGYQPKHVDNGSPCHADASCWKDGVWRCGLGREVIETGEHGECMEHAIYLGKDGPLPDGECHGARCPDVLPDDQQRKAGEPERRQHTKHTFKPSVANCIYCGWCQMNSRVAAHDRRAQTPPGSDSITDWLRQEEDEGCHEAADTIDRLTRERDEALARASELEAGMRCVIHHVDTHEGDTDDWTDVREIARSHLESIKAREAGILEDEK